MGFKQLFSIQEKAHRNGYEPHIFMVVMKFVYLVGEVLFHGSENSLSFSENQANPQT